MNIQKQIGKEIKRLRTRLGYSQEMLAEKALLSSTYIGKIERGERAPSISALQKLSEALYSSVGEFLYIVAGQVGRYEHEEYSEDADYIILARNALRCTLDDIQARFDKKGSATGIPSGLMTLDDITGGFHNCDLIVIGARPCMGKTALALTIIQNAAQNGNAVGFFSIDLSAVQLMSRLLCSTGKIDTTSLRGGFLEENDWVKVIDTIELLSNQNIVLDNSPRITINQIKQRAKLMQKNHGIEILLIDSLQSLFDESFKRYDDYSVVSRELKMLARELNIPVIITSQLSSNVEKRPNKRPMLWDLPGPTPVEQDADVVLLLYRDIYYHYMYKDGKPVYEMQEVDKTEINVAKNKSGPTGQVQVGFNRRYARFEDLEA